MKTAYLLYRKTEDFEAYPFAIDFNSVYADQMATIVDVNYVQLPYDIACHIYDNKLEVLEYVKGMNL